MVVRVKSSAGLLVLLMCAAFTIAIAGSPVSTVAEVGKAAPAFTLTDLDGKNHALADFKGKIVVLEWTNPNCPVVRRVYGTGIMSALQKEYVARGVVWLTVNSTHADREDHETPDVQKERYAAWKAGPNAQLLDPAGEVGRQFDAKTTPHMFIIDATGVLAYTGAVDDDPRGGRDERKNYVRDALDALLAGKTIATTVTRPYGCGVKY